MNQKPIVILSIKIIIDFIMAVLFILLMGYHLFSNVTHEIIGTILFTLFIIHNCLNWRWYRNIFKKKYIRNHFLEVIINILLLVTMISTIVSSLMLSRDVFYFLGFTSGIIGRKMHMISTIWSFILVAIHLGLHIKMFSAMIKKKVKLSDNKLIIQKILYIITFIIFCYGLIVFYNRSIWNEMFLLVEYKYMDFNESIILFIIDYISFFISLVIIGYYLKKLFLKLKNK